jgi:RNA polymerase sigma factor (TIGR02999 family)
MSQLPGHEVTALLLDWRRGDKNSYDRLFEILHGELHRLARLYMAGERPENMLQPTALVNEAYLRLIEINQVSWQDRAHFLAMAARVMRRILVDNARARRYQKRGGGAEEVTLNQNLLAFPQSDRDLIALDDALNALAAVDERKSRVVELKFFAGLNIDESSAVIGVSPETIQRDWRLARTWLLRELTRT